MDPEKFLLRGRGMMVAADLLMVDAELMKKFNDEMSIFHEYIFSAIEVRKSINLLYQLQMKEG